MKRKLTGIYGLQNKNDPNKWNIGQSRDIYQRWYTAYERGHCKSQPKIYNAIKKYGYDGFEKRIIELCDENIPQDMLDKKESAWIKHYNSVENGYNCTAGGNSGSSGRKCSEETKQKLRSIFTGRKVSDETRKKQSEAKKGVIFTEEHKKNISLATMGKRKSPYKRKKKRIVSEEVKQKISKTQKLRKIIISDWQRMRISITAKERWAKKRAIASP